MQQPMIGRTAELEGGNRSQNLLKKKYIYNNSLAKATTLALQFQVHTRPPSIFSDPHCRPPTQHGARLQEEFCTAATFVSSFSNYTNTVNFSTNAVYSRILNNVVFTFQNPLGQKEK